MPSSLVHTFKVTKQLDKYQLDAPLTDGPQQLRTLVRGVPRADGEPARGGCRETWPQGETVSNSLQKLPVQGLDAQGIGSWSPNDTSGPCSKRC